MAKAAKQATFEKSIGQLEELIDKIESGEAGLEDAISHYEKGVALIKQCRGILDAAEKKIARLTVDADGKLVARDDS